MAIVWGAEGNGLGDRTYVPTPNSKFTNLTNSDLFVPLGSVTPSMPARQKYTIILDKNNGKDVIWDSHNTSSNFAENFRDLILEEGVYLTIYNFDPKNDKIYTNINWTTLNADRIGYDTVIGSASYCMIDCEIYDYLYVFKDITPEEMGFSDYDSGKGLYRTGNGVYRTVDGYSNEGSSIAINSTDYSEYDLLYKYGYVITKNNLLTLVHLIG